MKRNKYFRIGDIIIYVFLIVIFSNLLLKINTFKDIKGSNVEIWVNGELKYVYPLQKEEKNVFVDTELGGCNVEFVDNKVRVTSSNSPLKIAVKQGFISSPGEVIIGVPDKLIIKITGEGEDDVDFVAR